MNDVSENTERQIVRSLDGVLGGEQQLELDRELIRNPQARRMMDEYLAADQLAAAALADLAGQARDVDQIVATATQAAPVAPTARTTSARPRQSHRTWMLIPGAIAAAILAMVIPKPTFDPAGDGKSPIVSTAPGGSSLPQLGTRGFPSGGGQGGAPLQTVGYNPSIQRRAGTEWIGVVGDDGNVYWIEVQRSRTIRMPQQKRREGGTFLEM